MTDKEPHPLPPAILLLYVRLVHLVREHGYALACHGSWSRDFDVIAVAWTEDAVTRQELIEIIADDILAKDYHRKGPDMRPHNRMSIGFCIPGCHGFLDLNVLGPDRR